MANDHVVEFTDANFEQEVVNADVPVLVDFWAEWCMPCKRLAPTIDELAEDFAGKVKVGKMDTDSNRNTAVSMGISAIPTVILFQNGEPKRKFVGLTSKGDFESALNELVGG